MAHSTASAVAFAVPVDNYNNFHFVLYSIRSGRNSGHPTLRNNCRKCHWAKSRVFVGGAAHLHECVMANAGELHMIALKWIVEK